MTGPTPAAREAAVHDPTASDVRVRSATPADLPDILRLVHGLADYEREPDAVEATEDDFRAALFPPAGPTGTGGEGAPPAGAGPTAHCEVAEHSGEVVGIALWFTTFSTWTGRPGIWLEDLFVDPEHRGSGCGTALLARLAQLCVERDYRRLEWSVLDWNTPSIGFYRSLGARPQDEWTTYRLTGERLGELAARGGHGLGEGVPAS